MKIYSINNNYQNNNSFQSKFSPEVNQFIEKELGGLTSADDKLFLSEYKKIVKNLKKGIENINPCKFGIIDRQGDYFIYKGYETEEKMEKNDWIRNDVVSSDTSKMSGYFKLIDILFEIKNKMTQRYQDEIHYRLPLLKHTCSGRKCSCCD